MQSKSRMWLFDNSGFWRKLEIFIESVIDLATIPESLLNIVSNVAIILRAPILEITGIIIR